ncbi:MAG: zf-TFIIB domain-containing protein [Lachnospiraceae bacterium]|nr:zf-TFIIB domain-containing protein [Lachnospiraceae bacterium]
MKQCPNCGSAAFEIQEMNGVELKKCSTCGAYYEDAGKDFEINSFVPVYERDSNGKYLGCPKCGCKEVHEISYQEACIRSTMGSALLSGQRYLPFKLIPPRYECTNPKCQYTWS